MGNPVSSAGAAGLPGPDQRWRCGGCGNLTRFDVARTRRTVEFWHVDLAGDVVVEDTEVRGEAVESVTCRWCGRSDAIELVPRAVPGAVRCPVQCCARCGVQCRSRLSQDLPWPANPLHRTPGPARARTTTSPPCPRPCDRGSWRWPQTCSRRCPACRPPYDGWPGSRPTAALGSAAPPSPRLSPTTSCVSAWPSRSPRGRHARTTGRSRRPVRGCRASRAGPRPWSGPGRLRRPPTRTPGGRSPSWPGCATGPRRPSRRCATPAPRRAPRSRTSRRRTPRCAASWGSPARPSARRARPPRRRSASPRRPGRGRPRWNPPRTRSCAGYAPASSSSSPSRRPSAARSAVPPGPTGTRRPCGRGSCSTP